MQELSSHSQLWLPLTSILLLEYSSEYYSVNTGSTLIQAANDEQRGLLTCMRYTIDNDLVNYVSRRYAKSVDHTLSDWLRGLLPYRCALCTGLFPPAGKLQMKSC